MKTIPALVLIIFSTITLFVSCQRRQTVSGPVTIEPFASAKITSHLPTDSVKVLTKITRNGSWPGDSLIVSFSKSISSLPDNFEWSSKTDLFGRTEIHLPTPGYYMAQVIKEGTGELIGRWHSIPLNRGESEILHLPIGEKATIPNGFLKDLLTAPSNIINGSQEYFISRMHFYILAELTPHHSPLQGKMLGDIELKTNDETPIPKNVIINQIYVINGEDIWAAQPSVTYRPEFVGISVQGGPPWYSRIVDVVVEIAIDNQKPVLLKASLDHITFIHFLVGITS